MNTPLRLRAFVPLCEIKGKFIIVAILAVLVLASCGELPSPLYGSWADNRGNTFSFFADNSFSARVAGTSGLPAQTFNGNYIVLLNILTLDCTNVDLRVVTEWDIRGNILYLNWISSESDAMSLTLFKISN
ncbi:MAG: hypothetical protein FWD26_07520 [Treponema sp.]|nr:hypothetical protein [Treponema sp.]